MADLGVAETPLRIDRQKISQPPILAKAAEVASRTLDLGATSPEERQRVIGYRSQPYLDQMKALTEQTNKYFEGQGGRFSTERFDRLGKQTTEIGRQLGESVMVPQIERERAEQRADLGLAAQIGGEQFQQALATEQLGLQAGIANIDFALRSEELAQRADQFAQTLGLDKERFVETVRQYNVSDERERTALAQTLHMDRSRLAETVRQFNAELGQAESQFVRTFGLAEVDSALRRAEATGLFVDPKSKISIETLQARRDQLNERVQRAIQIGRWIESGVDIDPAALLRAMGLNPDDFLGPAATGEPPPVEPPPVEQDPVAAVVAELTAAEREAQFIKDLPTWGPRLGGSTPAAMSRLVGEIGWEKAGQLFTRLATGESIPYAELLSAYGIEGIFALGDLQVVAGAGPDGQPVVHISNPIQAVFDATSGPITFEQWSQLPLEVQGRVPPPRPDVGSESPRWGLAKIRSGEWTQAAVDAVVAGLKSGAVTMHQLANLPITAERKSHILDRSRDPEGS